MSQQFARAARPVSRPAMQVPGQPPQMPMQAVERESPYTRDFFAYTISFAALAAGTTQNGQIQMQSDSQFELQKLSFFADVAAAAETESTRVLPLVTLQITDAGSGRQMFASAVPIGAVMGDGRIPFVLPTTKLFTPNASVAFEVSNYSAATAYNLRIVLLGAKIFKFG